MNKSIHLHLKSAKTNKPPIPLERERESYDYWACISYPTSFCERFVWGICIATCVVSSPHNVDNNPTPWLATAVVAELRFMYIPHYMCLETILVFAWWRKIDPHHETSAARKTFF